MSDPFKKKKEGGAPRRVRYAKKLDFYTLLYKRSLSSIKRLVLLGKQTGDLPPLDDPPAMPEWFARRFGKPAPAALFQIEKKDTGHHAKYARPLKDYAALYRTSPRTIKRWIQRGKQTGDFPPLDDVAAMRRWLARRMKRYVPSHFPSKSPKSQSEQTTLPFDT
jgi:hypothetical protein